MLAASARELDGADYRARFATHARRDDAITMRRAAAMAFLDGGILDVTYRQTTSSVRAIHTHESGNYLSRLPRVSPYISKLTQHFTAPPSTASTHGLIFSLSPHVDIDRGADDAGHAAASSRFRRR